MSDICWIYPLRGIPMEMPVKNSPHGAIQCEAGCQLEKKVDILLSGCVLENQDRKRQEGVCQFDFSKWVLQLDCWRDEIFLTIFFTIRHQAEVSLIIRSFLLCFIKHRTPSYPHTSSHLDSFPGANWRLPVWSAFEQRSRALWDGGLPFCHHWGSKKGPRDWHRNTHP